MKLLKKKVNDILVIKVKVLFKNVVIEKVNLMKRRKHS